MSAFKGESEHLVGFSLQRCSFVLKALRVLPRVFHVDQTSTHPDSARDPYQGVAILLLALTVLGTAGAIYGSATLDNPVLLDVAVTLTLSTGILIGVAWTRHVRARPSRSHDRPRREAPLVVEESEAAEPSVPPASDRGPERVRLLRVQVWARRWFQDLGEIGTISVTTGAVGALVIHLS